jgi:N-methylhydantoinase A
MSYLLGIDVGGTFTDFVAYDRSAQAIRVWKVPSVPNDPVVGILQGLEPFGERAEIRNIRLGTTVATNAILERSGAVVAYVTTRGFRDIPFIQRGNRRYHYDMSWVKPKPLVKRRHCFELTERIDNYGQVVAALDDGEVRRVAAEIRSHEEIEAVAVCLLFSYLNPSHELRVQEILQEELPGLAISISYQVLPKWKEYERASTTLADAYLKPSVSRQLRSMRQRMGEAELHAHTALIKSNGGEMTLDAAANTPVQMLVSGPTGGVIASREVAELTGMAHMVTLDMGGTSTDVSTVIDRKAAFTTSFEIEWGVPIQIPMIDIRTIGAGGGSIAWIDKGGMLRVGPESAGATPGPACYGGGGTEATVSDANLIVGRLNPENFLAGRMHLDVAAARRAVAVVAKALGQSIEETAMAIVRIANSNMVAALRSVLIERGLDPRDFTLCAFGGAGPLHASELIQEMGIPRAIIPNHPGQFSAYGFIMTDARVDRHRTTQLTSNHFDGPRAREAMGRLVEEAVAELADQGYTADIAVQRALEMRYLGQNYELELPIEGDVFDDARIDGLWQTFHEAHKTRFGFNIPGEIIEIVNCTATAVSRAKKPEAERLAPADGPAQARAVRAVRFPHQARETPIFRRDELRSGQVIDGPAVVEESASATIVNPGQRLTVDDYGHLLLEAAAGPQVEGAGHALL